MLIKTLIENNAVSEEFQTEHGLSLYIETGKYKLLFDTGASGRFFENAKKLGVALPEIDFAFISHGHHDHGGGLKLFLAQNARARVFVHKKAFEGHYARRPDGGLDFVGLDGEPPRDARLVLTEGAVAVAEGIELFADVRGRRLFSESNRALLMEAEDGVCEDTFEHEQNLIVTEGGRTFLFAGCAHNGIANILERFRAMKGAFPDYVFGGFHLYNPTAKTGEPQPFVAQLGEYLKDTPSTYYTGHCTGLEAYGQLRGLMGEQLQYLATGSVIEL